MKNIALIPIDNRPVCCQLPKMIAEIDKNINLSLPPVQFLGSLTKNANISAIFEWVEELKNTDYIIISADTLLYGGLIPSRRSSESFEEIDARLLKLRKILLSKQNTKVFMFSSIMRISNNNINEEEKEYWSEWGEAIFKYSYLLHQAEVEGKNTQDVIKISSEIPNEILIDWLMTRARNFEINKKLIGLYDDGIINTLIFSKDDCSKYGLNIKEANYLELKAENRKNVYVKTGADEIPLTLLSRCITKGKTLRVSTVYTEIEHTKLISKYEDISVKESVNSQLMTAGVRITSQEDADLILYVNNFKKEQGELVTDVETEAFSGSFAKFDKPFFIVDILNANGADNKFIDELFKQDLSKFFGYSGWNTTGNSLGGGIACAVVKMLAENYCEDAFKRLQTVRFLDDWAYQANLRKYFKQNNIKDEKLITEAFEPYMKKISEKLELKDYNVKYYFPWNRYFETGINLK